MNNVTFMVAAYTAFWIITMVYLRSIGKRQGEIQREIETLKKQLQE